MNISAGIAEISLQGTQGSSKLYTWPVYNAGKVMPVRPVQGKGEPAGYYRTVDPQTRDELISMRRNQSESTYSAKGTTGNDSLFLPPGSLFDALI